MLRDEANAIFIDRDPKLFSIILNYLRTKQIDLNYVNIATLRHEAEFYNVQPLIRRLLLCENMEENACGGLLFHGYLPATEPPDFCTNNGLDESSFKQDSNDVLDTKNISAFQRDMFRLKKTEGEKLAAFANTSLYAKNSSLDLRVSLYSSYNDHLNFRSQPTNFKKYIEDKSSTVKDIFHGALIEHLKVNLIKAHQNCVAIAYPRFISVYQLKEALGWQLIFKSPEIESFVERLSINAKMNINVEQQFSKLIAISYASNIRLWTITDMNAGIDIGRFDLTVHVDNLFFVNTQLVALSTMGKIGINLV